jgi:lipopolysaccharide assembly outer membrane protein LptD (OstA)
MFNILYKNKNTQPQSCCILKVLLAIVLLTILNPAFAQKRDSAHISSPALLERDSAHISGTAPVVRDSVLILRPYTPAGDSLQVTGPDTLVSFEVIIPEDTTAGDTITGVTKKKEKSPIEAEVFYHSRDSFKISLSEQKVYLYGEAQVNYQNIELTADYIVFDMSNNVVMATSLSDSLGKPTGKPVFKQGNETFQSDTLRYNFETRKGVIKYIFTQQGEGYLHSKQTKRLSDGEIHLKSGKYTTCDAEHPHFYIGLTKAIAIPEKKIVSGPAYLVLEDIPLPLILPFGFFPNTKERSSGLLIPTYGYEERRGLYLRNGGWYFAINDYVDLSIMSDIYFYGTWGVSASSKYVRRYKFSGSFSGQYYQNVIENETPIPTKSTDYSIRWSHTQSPKANPTRSFSASVNLSSSSYDKNQSYGMTEYLTNTKSSSISFSKRWAGTPFNLAASLNHSQNSLNKSVNMNLPKVSFNMSRIYPLRFGKSSGKFKWFENIQISYSANFENRISATDSTLFTESTLRGMKNGFTHSIPVTMANLKLFNLININPSLNYKGVMYGSHIEKSVPDTAFFYSGGKSGLVVDTVRGLCYAHAVVPSISFSVNPKLYGMIQSANEESYFMALRHVITPSASFGFTPDVSGLMPDYYRNARYPTSVQSTPEEYEYSIFENYIYGTPMDARRSGSVSFGLNNNLEAKVRPKNDTTGTPKKIKLIENLNFAASYNPFADDKRWSNISMTGSTRLLQNKINLRIGSTFSPYALDSLGRESNLYLLKESGKLARLTRASIDISMSLRSQAGGKKGDEKEEQKEVAPESRAPDVLKSEEQEIYGDYVDFSIPWSLSFTYNWSYSKPGFAESKKIISTVRVSGDVSLTKKWKIGGNTGYDFEDKKITVTNISIHRDLHCWEMRFAIVPFGPRKHYSFTINAKSAILRDLKYDKKKSWYDYM